MARRRMIDPSFWDDDAAGPLPDSARILVIGCVSNADCYGKLTGSPASLKKIVWGFHDRTVAEVAELLTLVSQALSGFHCYEVAGKPYIALLHWWRYQRVDNPTRSTIPDPPDAAFDPPCPYGNIISQNGSENGSQNGSERREGEEEKEVSNQEKEVSNQQKERAPARGSPAYQLLDSLLPGTVKVTDYEQLDDMIEDFGNDEVVDVLKDMKARKINRNGVMAYLRAALKKRQAEKNKPARSKNW